MKSRIGELIKEKGYRSNFIAEKVGVTPQQLSAWVNDRAKPTLDKARKLAKILGVNVEDLYEWED